MASTYEELMLKARELAAQGDEYGARRLAQIALQRKPPNAGAALSRSVTDYGQSLGIAPGEQPSQFAQRFVDEGIGTALAQEGGLSLETASYRDFMDAARNAHSAGDAEAARRLVQLAQQRQQSEPSQFAMKMVDDAIGPTEVELPDGTIVEFPAGMSHDEIQAVMREKFPPSNQQPQQTAPDVGAVGGASAAATDGMLFGFGDEYLAGLSSVLGVQPDGQGGANWFDYSKPIGERYSTALDAIRREQSQFSEDRPGLAIGAEIAGSVIGPGKGASSFISAGKSGASQIARGTALGAASGGAYGFGEGEGGILQRLSSAPLSAAAGGAGGLALSGIGRGFARASQALKRRTGGSEAASALEGLRDEAQRLYGLAGEMQERLPAAKFSGMVDAVKGRLRDDGYDAGLHPRLKAVLKRFGKEQGDKSLADLEILRRVAGNAAASLQPDERRLASRIIDEIDGLVDQMEGGPLLSQARNVWGQLRRMELIEDVVTKASDTDNFVASLRSQFRSLLKSKTKLRGFSDDEIKAIRQVARGTNTEKALRGLGKLFSPTSLQGLALAGGTAYATGPAALSLPLLGMAAQRGANSMTRGSLSALRGQMAGQPIQALGNPLSGAVPLPGLLAVIGQQQ